MSLKLPTITAAATDIGKGINGAGELNDSQKA